MSAAQFIGRVGGIATALGVGVAILSAPAVAGADTDGADSSSRPSASAGSSRPDSAPGSRRGSRAVAARAEASAAPQRGSAAEAAPEFADPVPAVLASPATVPAPAAATVTVPAPSAAVPAPVAATNLEYTNLPGIPFVSSEQQLVDTSAPKIYSPTPPSPSATTPTPLGEMGRWMLNKEGQVADWIGQPYCGPGSTVGNCTKESPNAKTMQEPINVIFVVTAPSQYLAELQLDFAMKVAGFGPSCCSSVGYSGLVRGENYKQFPRGGPLGLGILAPLPNGLFQNGLLGLAGIGPAYRDFPFLLTNNHVRNFGGAPDGKGSYVFTASASKEILDTSAGLLPTHSFESYEQARTKLTNNMLKKARLTKATNQGMVAMNNAIDPNNPTYTTGDHDGMAQVIALSSFFGAAPVRTKA
ncbi:MAG: hypothetical protein FGM52_12925 [Mycobacterium sp.]|nr:hypothetical protein [Mycobacterium sp.]